jgi:hypothetical protein
MVGYGGLGNPRRRLDDSSPKRQLTVFQLWDCVYGRRRSHAQEHGRANERAAPMSVAGEAKSKSRTTELVGAAGLHRRQVTRCTCAEDWPVACPDGDAVVEISEAGTGVSEVRGRTREAGRGVGGTAATGQAASLA